MERRRDFLKCAAALGARSVFSSPFPKLQAQAHPGTPAEVKERSYWLAVLERLARPVLENLARGELKKDRKSTRLNSSHLVISYAVFCLKKKKKQPLTALRRRQSRTQPRTSPGS